MIKKIYLTIDDSPSIHMDKKVNFLLKEKIPAIFYLRGEYILKNKNQVINAIDNDFIIGNHSFSHPLFSQISLKDCFDEINKTEALIEECYLKSSRSRDYKVIRLPFADRGAGEKAKLPTTPNEHKKVKDIQNFLRENGFEKLAFQSKSTYIDSYWDWDTEDYKRKYIQDKSLYLKNLECFYSAYKDEIATILLHDFDHSHHLFEESMRFLLDKNVVFLEPTFSKNI